MIKLLRNGNWAVEGLHIVEMIEGVERSFGPAEDFKLVAAGWAQWVDVVLSEEQEQEQGALADVVADAVAEEAPRKPRAK